MMIGFSFFDLILGVFVKGRKLPLSEKWYEFKAKGWVFGAFLIGIAFATISSAFLAQIATGSVNQPSLSLGDRVARVAIADVLATFLLWLDFDSKVWNA